MQYQNFLFEIGTEDLPAHSLQLLMHALQENFTQELNKAELTHHAIKTFATPRRLAVLIQDLQTQQPQRCIERKGPALNAAYDAQGNPSKALEGFARSCGVAISALEKQKTAQGEWVIYRAQQPGKSAKEILPEIVGAILHALPIKKPMRWNQLADTFVRPVHWLLMLLGKETISATFFAITTQPFSYGHRFHHAEAVAIQHPDDYLATLKSAKVIADFAERRTLIEQQITRLAQQKEARVIFSSELLDEVTGLVEWPVALLGTFDTSFLQLPREVLITTIEVNQRCFPLEDSTGKLLPYFITVSNIESQNAALVIHGNERVVRARLSDAKFFYETDCKHTLPQYTDTLKKVVFQAKLGSMFDKIQRLNQLARFLCMQLSYTQEPAQRAAALCKSDLLTSLVSEFPELQGTMGYYYALHEGESIEVALAIRDHYKPRSAADMLPETLTGSILAIADKLDTLIGNFSINQIPTGEKDPFGLRRAALGILRIIIEKALVLNLTEAIAFSYQQYREQHPEQFAKLVLPDQNIKTFIYERLYNWYADKNISADRLDAVLSSAVANAGNLCRHYPLTIHTFVTALNNFIAQQLAVVQKIVLTNKRIRNILKDPAAQADRNIDEIKCDHTEYWQNINPTLFQSTAETNLYTAIKSILEDLSDMPLVNLENYAKFLLQLANLQPSVDRFFDEVKVMEENRALRNNRLNLMKSLRKIFLKAADFSLLQI